jgi:glycosyltransferase involved in cell wall biosynthesis
MALNILQMISKNDRYGAQRIFLDQVSVLHSLGNRVTVVCRGSAGYVTDSVQAMGVPCHGIPMKGIGDILFLRQLVKKNNIDVIHTTLDRADHFGLIVARITGRPVVSTMMVPRYHVGFKFADRVIVLANKQRDLLLQNSVKAARIAVIRPGINVDRFAHADAEKRKVWRQKLRTDSRSIVLCHISSLIPRKSHEVSLEIIAACKQQGENPLLVIIGDPLSGAYYDSLLAKIKELGLQENVHFTGWTSDVAEILSLTHITVLPSENEALGIVLMEGMAAGTPIVAREGEGGAELIDEYGTGLLYRPAAGVPVLADALVALRRDPARFATLSAKCRQIAVDQFSMQRFGERLTELYATVCPAS